MCMIIISGMRTATVAEEMPLTRAAHGTSQPSPPLGWCTVDEALSTLAGWHGWWQQPRSARRRSVRLCFPGGEGLRAEGGEEVPQSPAVSGCWGRGGSLSLAGRQCPAHTAALRRLAARQTRAGWVWAHGVRNATTVIHHNETAHSSGLSFQSKSMKDG